MELEKGTKKLKVKGSRLKTAAPSPAGDNIDAPEDSPDRDLLRQKMAQKVGRKDGRPVGACCQVVDMGGLEFFTTQIESADGENLSEIPVESSRMKPIAVKESSEVRVNSTKTGAADAKKEMSRKEVGKSAATSPTFNSMMWQPKKGDGEEATSPAAPQDSRERELLRQKMAQKRAGSTITPIVGQENKIESGKRTKKENERTNQNASPAPPPQKRLGRQCLWK